MPLDGSYGRLSAHNQRSNELRRKQLARKEKTKRRNNLNMSSERNVIDKEVDLEKLKLIKRQIRENAKSQRRKELYILLFVSILLIAITILIFI